MKTENKSMRLLKHNIVSRALPTMRSICPALKKRFWPVNFVPEISPEAAAAMQAELVRLTAEFGITTPPDRVLKIAGKAEAIRNREGGIIKKETLGKEEGLNNGGVSDDGGCLSCGEGVSPQELGVDSDFISALRETIDNKVRFARENADAAGVLPEDLPGVFSPCRPCNNAALETVVDDLWDSYAAILNADVHGLLSNTAQKHMGLLRMCKRDLGEPHGFCDCLQDVLTTYLARVGLTAQEKLIGLMNCAYPDQYFVLGSPVLEEEYLQVRVFICLSIFLSALIIGSSSYLATQKPNPEKLSAYECGFEPYEDAKNRFDVRFYVIALLFVLFDVEIVLLAPWCASLSSVTLLGYWSMIEFLLELGLAFGYVWCSGALEQ